jgi:hypothetical protein
MVVEAHAHITAASVIGIKSRVSRAQNQKDDDDARAQ